MIRLIRELLAIVPEIRGRIWLAGFCKALESVFAGIPFGLLCLTLHTLLSGRLTEPFLWKITAGIAVCVLCQGIFFYLFTRISYPAGTVLSERIRIRLAQRLRDLPMGFFDAKSIGDLNSLITEELNTVAHLPTMAFPHLITSIILPAVIGLFLCIIDWRLGIAAISAVVLALPLLHLGEMILRKGILRRSSALARLSSRIIEYIQGIPVVKGFSRTGNLVSGFQDAMDDYNQENLNVALTSAPAFFAFMGILDTGFLLVLLLGCHLLQQDSIPLFSLLIFIILSLRLYEPIKGIPYVYSLVRSAERTLERIREVLESPPLPVPESTGTPENSRIDFENVNFSYDRTPVLQNVSFSARKGRVTAIVGPSGAGKTSILRLLTRFWDVTSGAIRIGGCDVRDMTPETLYRQISIVFQDVFLFRDTVFGNIAFGVPNASEEEVHAAARAARCDTFIRNLPHGYDTMVGEGGVPLSGGERQRISIARAILKNSPIVLLDEATASVDPENETRIQEALSSLAGNRTLLVISHRLSTINQADRILVLTKDGQVAETGTHDALLAAKGRYAAMWQQEQESRDWQAPPPAAAS